MTRSSNASSIWTLALAIAITCTLMVGNVFVFNSSNAIFGNILIMVFGFIGVVAIALVEVFSKGPFQELKILVDLPANTNVEVAPLLLNSVDASLFGFLLPKCTQTVDHEQILLYYKGHGEIYDPKRSVFTVKGPSISRRA